MKKLVILFAFLVLFNVVAIAEEIETVIYESGDFEYVLLNDGTVEIVDYNSKDEILRIPEVLDGLTISSIGDEAFSGNENLKEIFIPDCIVRVGANPFVYCKRLGQIQVSDEHPVLEVKDGVLFDKTEKRLISYPNALKEKIYTVPDGTKWIGKLAFAYSKYINQVIISDGVNSIDDWGFYYCQSLAEVNLPDSVSSLGINPFAGCNELKQIGVSTYSAFQTESGVLFDKATEKLICYPGGLGEKVYSIPEGTVAIEASAFEGNEMLKEIVIPYGVTTIGDFAFAGCKSLSQIVIPDSVTSIGSEAFYDCDAIRQMELPESVEIIGTFAFGDCGTLYSVSLPRDISTIVDGLFCNCVAIKELVIPEGVTSIGALAFCECTRLREITIPEGVRSIGKHAFAFCDALSHVTMPASVETIGDRAFVYCISLEEIYIPQSVTFIGEAAFKGADDVKLKVEEGSYAKKYAKENKVPYKIAK